MHIIYVLTHNCLLQPNTTYWIEVARPKHNPLQWNAAQKHQLLQWEWTKTKRHTYHCNEPQNTTQCSTKIQRHKKTRLSRLVKNLRIIEIVILKLIQHRKWQRLTLQLKIGADSCKSESNVGSFCLSASLLTSVCISKKLTTLKLKCRLKITGYNSKAKFPQSWVEEDKTLIVD